MQPTTSKAIDRIWADAFAKALINPKLPPGAGWMTLSQVVAKQRLNRDRARQLLKRLVAEGQFERFDGQQTDGKRVFRAVYYRPKGLKNAV